MLVFMQAVLAALAAGLTFAMASALRHRSASEWVMSWLALAAFLLFGSVQVPPSLGPFSQVINVAARVLEVSAGAMQVALLVEVAWIYGRTRPLPRGVQPRLVLVSVGLGLVQAMIFGGQSWMVTDGAVGRVDLHAILTGTALPITGIWLLLISWPRVTIARLVLAGVYMLLGSISLLKIAYVMGFIATLPPSVTLEFVALVDVARYTALGVAAALILVEKLEEKASTSAEDAARAREARDRSDSWFRTLVENAPEIVLVVDRGGRCVYVSQSVTRTAGWLAADLVGQNVFDFIHLADRDRVRFAINGLKSSAPNSLPVEFRIRTQGDDHLTVEATSVHLPGTSEGDEAATCIIIARDVTARNAAEDRERRLAQQLFRSQKTESLGRLASGVAHDFNNLLTVVFGHSSVARRLIGRDHPALTDLDKVDSAARRAGTLTRQLLVYSRHQVTERTPIEFDRVVADLSQMLSRVVGENIQFETRLGAEGVFVSADRGQLEQVLVNLVLNACDAMGDGGHIRVETGLATVDDSHNAVATGVTNGTHAVVTVSDTGRGIPNEARDLVFEPFFTTKAPQGGTGLGLAISEGIVQQHRGRIWFESSAEGTRFHFCLPRVERPFLQMGPADLGRPRSGPRRVLLVEDDADVRSVAARALREHGYQVVDFGDPLTGRLTAAAEPFDVLVTDIVMPRLSGLLLAEQIASVQPLIKVLFISGYSQDSEEVGAASRLAGHRFLAKPFEPADLARAVGELLAEELRHRAG